MITRRVDVIIPVYNGAKTVESAVASIQAQTVRDIRILIINDGSTDSTKEIVERLAAADERVVLLDRANGGIVDALNAGLAACSADIVARHDADDLAHPQRFEKQLAYLDKHRDCAAVSGAFSQIDEAGRSLGPIQHLPSPDLANLDWYPQREPYLLHPFLMMRRAAVEAVGGYRHVFHAEDTDLFWRLQEKGRLVNMPDVLGEYRIHTQSVTSVSVVNGRISALNSQLAGLSARRRRAGRADIEFRKAALQEYQEARTLEGIVRLGSRGLDLNETERLAATVSAKLLESAGYRPYELEFEDCTFIRKAISKAMPHMTSANRRTCSQMLSGTTARLAYDGKISAALQLASPALYLVTAARLALRVTLPATLRRSMRKAIGRNVYVK